MDDVATWANYGVPFALLMVILTWARPYANRLIEGHLKLVNALTEHLPAIRGDLAEQTEHLAAIPGRWLRHEPTTQAAADRGAGDATHPPKSLARGKRK